MEHFLEGAIDKVKAGEVSGWVHATTPGDWPHVHLTLNGKTIARTRAILPEKSKTGEQRLRFFFPIADVLLYMGPEDVLACETGGKSLKGKIDLERTGKYPADSLFELLNTGHVFNKFGELQLSKLHNVPWQKSVFSTFAELRQFFARDLGYELFPCYGTLLGAVRDNNFIGHDDDFDCVYISALQKPADLRVELYTVSERLIHAGFLVQLGVTCIHAKLPGPRNATVDIFHAYFDSKERFIIPFGLAGDEPYRKADLTGWESAFIGDTEITVPVNSSKLLAWIYGDNWRIPDPTFSWKRSAKIRINDAYPSIRERRAVFWTNFYRSAAPSASPTMAEGLHLLAASVGTICDLGCGPGEFLRALGSKVPSLNLYGCDNSTLAIDVAKRGLATDGIEAEIRNVDFYDTDELNAFIRKVVLDARYRCEKVLFSLVRITDAVSMDCINNILACLKQLAEPGDLLLVEHREYLQQKNTLARSSVSLADVSDSMQQLLPDSRQLIHEQLDGAQLKAADAKTLKSLHRFLYRL